MKNIKTLLIIFLLFTCQLSIYGRQADSLWLRYQPIQQSTISDQYNKALESVSFETGSATLDIIGKELMPALERMLGKSPDIKTPENSKLIISKASNLKKQTVKKLQKELTQLSDEGFLIKTIDTQTFITSKTDVGLLYGTYHFLRLLQTQQPIQNLSIIENPKIDIRILNHWDNLDRTVERGYAGFSIWNWHKLPEYIDQRYIDYARANASIGINGTVLTNVNANALILTPAYLEKVAALADVFRPYGIKVYLTARFSAPIEIGGLSTADPLNEEVQNWWTEKVNEIYKYVPDFGGFTVKANSEGQPGPQNYNRTHVAGANMMAKALAPHNGIVMWRAFVYSEHDPDDRAKQAYSEFVPFDGQFADNVLVQVKNGAIDFQPREPFHPMFGAMPKTPLMMEFQITQEYLGFSSHLVFLPQLFKEVLEADTYQKGENSTVEKVIDGSLHNNKIAGVANIGTDDSWTGHPFLQANWYGYGRLAWNPSLAPEQIAEEWLRSTFSNEESFVKPMKETLINSRETVVKYMTPLGLHHIMDAHHHYGPGPWISDMGRADWTSVYYHKADSFGIGFDRSESGSNAIAQYASPLRKTFNDPETTPEELLLWFHHLPWDYQLKSGKTLWDGIALMYQEGVDEVKDMKDHWQQMKPYVDDKRFEEVEMLLEMQLKEAKWWRNACLLYFQEFSELPLPEGVDKAPETLEHYQSLEFPFAPGIRPDWN